MAFWIDLISFYDAINYLQISGYNVCNITSYTDKKQNNRGGWIIVWTGITPGSHTTLHVFYRGILASIRYCEENLDPYVKV